MRLQDVRTAMNNSTSTTRRGLLVVCTASFLILPLISFGAATQRVPVLYEIADLGTLGGPFGSASSITDSGLVGGSASYTQERLPLHGFVYGRRGMVDIGTLGGLWSGVNDIAKNGLAVGYAYLADGSVRAVAYKSGHLRNLGTLGGNESYAAAVNSQHGIVGYSTLRDEAITHAFFYRGSVMRDLGVPMGFHSSLANGINDDGAIIVLGTSADRRSYHTFLLQGQRWTDIGSLGGAVTIGLKINTAGHIVGFSHPSAVGLSHAFSYRDGVMTDLGTLGGVQSVASSLNDRGEIVGYSSTTTDPEWVAFLHRDGVMWNLNELLIDQSGWLVRNAFDINNAGEIVGRAERNGETRAVLLTPVQ